MATSTLTQRLKELGGSWKKQRKRAKEEGGTIPDGRYIGRLADAEVSDSGSTLRFKLVFTVLEGDHQGETLTKSDGLENEDSLFYLGKLLARFGYDPEEVEIENLEKIAKELKRLKPVCSLQAKSKNDFQNVYVNSVIEDYEESDGADDDEDEDEDEETEADSEDGGEIGVGTKVSGTFRGADFTGVVTEIVDDETVKVKRDDTGSTIKRKIEDIEIIGGDSSDSDEEEEEEEETEADSEEEEEEVELAEGMRVSFSWKGKDETGEVLEIVDDERAKVKKDSDGKTAVVKIENLTGPLDEDEDESDEEEEEEEETPEPPKKRGPGRPPKSPPATPAKSTPTPAKRGPGRPKGSTNKR